ncbi:MAG: hypothetical protein NTX05_01325 [Fusobacteria bacterium]|nr:hypothetical protein [Fusobacteriota bacterium]
MKKKLWIVAGVIGLFGTIFADNSVSLQEMFPGNVIMTGGMNSGGYGQVELGYNFVLPNFDIAPSITYYSQGFGVSLMGLYAVPETFYLVSIGGYVSDFQGGVNVGPIMQVTPLSNLSLQAGYLFGATPGAIVSIGYNFL